MDTYSTEPTALRSGTVLMLGDKCIGIIMDADLAEHVAELLNAELNAVWVPAGGEECADA